MKILVVGAGATGGYFGARLLEAGRDVTFLVRSRRAAQLAATGLVIQSPLGDAHLADPPVVLAENLRDSFDLVLVSCKAYDLDAAADSFAPAVGATSAVLPLLNGMRHIDRLGERFGTARILGGTCLISSTLDADGRIVHLNAMHDLAFGELDGHRSAHATAIADEFSHASFGSRLSEAILHDMWEKWVLIATSAGSTCFMRGTIGDIVAAGAEPYASAMLEESAGIARACGFPPSANALERIRALLGTPHSSHAASMFRDIERHAPIEGDHIVGDLIRRGEENGAPPAPLLRLAAAHLRTYEARRLREA